MKHSETAQDAYEAIYHLIGLRDRAVQPENARIREDKIIGWERSFPGTLAQVQDSIYCEINDC